MWSEYLQSDRTVYALFGDPDLPATHWAWSRGPIGVSWTAVTMESIEVWWDGADEEDVQAAPDPWFIPLDEVPEVGTLIFRRDDGSECYIQMREFEVETTIKFRTNVTFSDIDRDRFVTDDDAMEAFLGSGLSEVMGSGEYAVEVLESRIRDL